MLLALCAGIGGTDIVYAQTTNTTWQGSVSLITTTNVTYAKYMWLLPCCQVLDSKGPLVREGNNLSYNFDIIGPPECECQSIAIETTDVTLGTLVPGVYTLVTTSWGEPVATNTFTVAPVLQADGFDTNGDFQIQMSGAVTGVDYVLQCSSDLVNWTSLSTNTFPTNAVGVVLIDNSAASSGLRFYRTLCQ